MKITAISGFTSQSTCSWAKAKLNPGVDVRSDGLACFEGGIGAGCTHSFVVVGQRNPRDLLRLSWINTQLVRLKPQINGAPKLYHSPITPTDISTGLLTASINGLMASSCCWDLSEPLPKQQRSAKRLSGAMLRSPPIRTDTVQDVAYENRNICAKLSAGYAIRWPGQDRAWAGQKFAGQRPRSFCLHKQR
jgi:hypothetical protein